MSKAQALESAPPDIALVAGAGAFGRLVRDIASGRVEFAPPESEERHAGRTAELRQALRRHGPATAAELAARADIPVKLVSALLGHDIEIGRVLVCREGRTRARTLSYEINRAYEASHRGAR
jgi:hypothetical protein